MIIKKDVIHFSHKLYPDIPSISKKISERVYATDGWYDVRESGPIALPPRIRSDVQLNGAVYLSFRLSVIHEYFRNKVTCHINDRKIKIQVHETSLL